MQTRADDASRRVLAGLVALAALVAGACGLGSSTDQQAQVDVRVVDGNGTDGEAAGDQTSDDDAAGSTEQADADGTQGAASTAGGDGGGVTGNPPAASAGGPGGSAVAAALEADPLAEAAELTFDQPLDGEIEQLFGSDYWTFTGTAGQLLTIDVANIGGPESCSMDLTLLLLDTGGERLDIDWIGNGGCEGHGPIELTADGEYALIFAGGDGGVISDTTGPYRFTASFLTEMDSYAPVFGEANDGEITQLLGSDAWTFSASAGQVLTVDVAYVGGPDLCQMDLTMRLRRPNGETEDLDWVGNGGCEGHGPITLDADGEYSLIFAGGDGGVISRKVGPYRFTPALVG